MKKTILYLLFFIMLLNGTAQQKASKYSLLLPPVIDSIQLANAQLAEGTNRADNDTATALRLLRSAAGIFHNSHLSKQEGNCRMAIGNIYFEAEQYNRSFGNYLAAEDLFYE